LSITTQDPIAVHCMCIVCCDAWMMTITVGDKFSGYMCLILLHFQVSLHTYFFPLLSLWFWYVNISISHGCNDVPVDFQKFLGLSETIERP
jgi:hypothetical protein